MRAKQNSKVWIVRDLGIFLYGCIFAGRCIFKLKNARDSDKESTTTRAPVLAFRRRNFYIA
jgi:hypothetical protein